MANDCCWVKNVLLLGKVCPRARDLPLIEDHCLSF